ncbi:UNVERIFIED_CONTAM: hypothetical protein Sradi_0776700 [Sesamum radiatum]|uniref:DUF4283 domain-containing protein n=1 Tax=Sesamum radiatum TaxID=300843 RepID=A0AAW2VU60_SESRA
MALNSLYAKSAENPTLPTVDHLLTPKPPEPPPSLHSSTPCSMMQPPEQDTPSVQENIPQYNPHTNMECPPKKLRDEYSSQHVHNQTPSSSSHSQAQSYKQRLMNNSTHVYFPTWIRKWEPSSNTEINPPSPYPSSLPNIQFSLEETQKVSFSLGKNSHCKGHYLLKFKNPDDYFVALAGGPWFLFNSYVHVQQWKPWFSPSEEPPKTIFLWIQLPQLPIEYFHVDALFRIGKLIGRPIKTDSHTFSQSKGRYARLCIEVETTKPLPPALVIDNHVQQIKYELHMAFCSNCGAIGHLPATCSLSQTGTQGPADSNDMNHSTPKYQWQFVQTKKKSTGNNRKFFDDDMAKSQGTTPSTFTNPKGWSHKPNIKPNKKTFTQKWVRKTKESSMEVEKSSVVVPIMNTFSRLRDDLSVELVNTEKEYIIIPLYAQSENWIIKLRHQMRT